MNFHYMPELGYHWAYFVVLGVMAASCLGIYVLFKRSKWL
jgi:magnesium transporter